MAELKSKLVERFGIKEWRLPNGDLHRLNGPAAIWPNSLAKHWWVNGKRHRVGGPAMENGNGHYWFNDDKLHRTDGPAVEHVNGDKEWWVNGKRHRIDGPAFVEAFIGDAPGFPRWWLYGKALRDHEVKKWIEENSLSVPFTPEQQMLFVLRWGGANV